MRKSYPRLRRQPLAVPAVTIARIVYRRLYSGSISGIDGLKHRIRVVVPEIRRVSAVLTGMIHVGIPKAGSALEDVVGRYIVSRNCRA